MGGLVAIRKGEAHIAGTHLLDEATGEYNVPYIKKMLGDKKMLLVNLVYREQGFMVLKGNPKNIRGFGDLLRRDVCFINRQGGSGTRLLTDKHLRDLNISPQQVNGYEREEYTHMGVASAVLSGVADTGMGILAAAQALDLEFIPVAKERYDLLVPTAFAELPHIAALLGIIRSSTEFRNLVTALGGYDITDMGKTIYAS
jgi:putative molybdopterin biosynthesis protein